MSADLRRAFASNPDPDQRTAVMATLRLFARTFPHLAARFDPEDPDVLRETVEGWEIAVGGYGAGTILEAGRRMVRRMSAETTDIAPTAPRLAAFCREVTSDVPKAPAVPAIEETDEAAQRRLEDHAANMAAVLWSMDQSPGTRAEFQTLVLGPPVVLPVEARRRIVEGDGDPVPNCPGCGAVPVLRRRPHAGSFEDVMQCPNCPCMAAGQSASGARQEWREMVEGDKS